uniref:Uncharacterized protein n=1 Tax=Anopheles quadriannulatus TaxID=34691 RepID=A0A182XSX6_ANOQN
MPNVPCMCVCVCESETV